MPELDATWALVERGGLLFVFFALAAGQALAYFRKWIIPGWLLAERDARLADTVAAYERRVAVLESEVTQWRTLALQSIGLSSRFAAVALPTGALPPTPPPTTPTTGGS